MGESENRGVIVVAPAELARIVREAVREELATREQNQAPEWLDTEGAAAVLGVHRKTILKLVREESLPAYRAGEKILRFRRSDLAAWLEQRAA